MLLNSKGIELLYIWIKKTKYDCFENQGFNLSYDFNIEYDDETNILRIDKNKNINIFATENQVINNLTAIVGNNGVGKTTLLTYIMNLKMRLNNNLKKDTLLVYRLDGDIIFDNLLGKEIQIINNTQIALKSYVQPSSQYVFDRIEIAYISVEYTTKKEMNVSRNKKINFITPNSIDRYKSFIKMKSIDGTRGIGFNFENYISILYCLNYDNRFDDYEVTIRFNSSIVIHNTVNEKEYLISKINSFGENNIGKAVFSFFEELKKYNDMFRNKFMQTPHFYNLEELENVKNEFLVNENSDINSYFINAIDEIYEFNKLLGEIYQNTNENKKSNVITCKIKQLRGLMKLFERKGKSFLLKFLKIEINKSDGEIALLRQLAYLYYLSNQNNFTEIDSSVSYLIMLDEIDVHLHPEWQKQLINTLVSKINEMFKNKNVQILLTTHSPLVLSDIPAQNIIYLSNDGSNKIIQKREDIKTFGASIYNLYNDSFYFNGNVLMGDYAKNYIDTLYLKIKNDLYNSELIKYTIDMIGGANYKK